VDYSWSVTGTALPFWALLGSAVALTAGHIKAHHRDTETRRGTESGKEPPQVRREPDGRAARRREWSQRPTPSPQRLLLGAGGVLLLALNGVWLTASEHQDRARAAVSDPDLQRRDPQAANDEYQAAAALAPLDAELQVRWAGIEEALGDRPGADRALRRAGTMAPTWGRPHYRLGPLLERA